ncbi:MAG: anion permease [Gammaproteobacteria bacterium]|jgi:solute carrier family 13 (sodium-dependent dicarboxylate transporter), member 2/3/5
MYRVEPTGDVPAPNAIVFSSRYVTIPQMARAGFYMNLVAALVITLFVIVVLPFIDYY